MVDYYKNYTKKQLNDALERFVKDLKKHNDKNDRFKLSDLNVKALKNNINMIKRKLYGN